MKRLPRIRIKTLMILVAVSAFAIVAPGEHRNRLERSRLEGARAFRQERAGLIDRERAYCLVRAGREPYDRDSRREYLRDRGFWNGYCHVGYFDDWIAEASWHEQQAIDCRSGAIYYEHKIREIRSRHLIPWI